MTIGLVRWLPRSLPKSGDTAPERSAMGGGFNRSMQQLGEIVPPVFRSLESFAAAR